MSKDDHESGPTAVRHPLSINQQALWRYQQMFPASPTYGMVGVACVRGPLAPSRLRDAWRRLLGRHAVLRSWVVAERGEPWMVERAVEELGAEELLPVADATGWSLEQFNSFVDRQKASAHRLDRPTLFRGVLLHAPAPWISRLAPPVHGSATPIDAGPHPMAWAVLMTAHHLVVDFLSFSLILEDLEAFCQGPVNGDRRPSTVQAGFWAFAGWEKQWLASPAGRQATQAASAFAAGLEALAFEGLCPEPGGAGAGGEHRASIPPEVSRAVEACARANGVTPYVAMLSVFQVLLWWHCSASDIHVATPVHGRHDRAFRRMIGYFANIVPIRQTLRPGDTFKALLQRNHAALREALRNGALPFPVRREASGVPESRPGKSPLAQVALVWDVLDGRARMGEHRMLGILGVEQTGTPYDLLLTMYIEPGAWACGWQFDNQAISAAGVERLASDLCAFAGLLASACETPIGSLSFVAAPAWSSAPPVSPGPGAASIEHALCHFARTNGDAPALRQGGTALTYALMESVTRRIGAALARTTEPDRPVAILMERGLDAVLAFVAAYRGGRTYVPLNPGQPRAWLRQALENASPQFVLCSPGTAELAASLAWPSMTLASLQAGAPEGGGNLLPADVEPGGLAYVIYTSGSTGSPKGVAVTRASLQHLLAANPLTMAGPEQRWTLMHHPSFDFSAWEVWGALSGGHTLCVLGEDEFNVPATVADVVQRHGITHMGLTPAAAQLLLPLLEQRRPPALREICLGGAAVPPVLVERLRALGLKTRILYGPTEATVWATSQSSRDPAPGFAIGFPLPGLRAYVLNPHLQWVPAHQAGELYLSGPQLAQYFAAPRLTAASFVPDPWHRGERMYRTGDRARYSRAGIEFIGRADRQVKVSGYRVELDEIERRLSGRAGIAQLCCVQSDDGGVTAVYTTPDGQPLAQPPLHAAACEALPRHVLPIRFVFMRDIPVTPNCKPDLKALRAAASLAGPPAIETGAGRDQETLAQLIAHLFRLELGIAEVPRDVNFQELGANSMTLMRLSAELSSRIQRPVEAVDLYASPTIDRLAQSLCLETGPAPPAVARRAARLARGHAASDQG